MATYKTRGNAHNVIYTYKTQSGERKQQWETYPTELEAVQRKAYIDYLQRNKMQSELEAAAREYLQMRGISKPQETKKTETKIGQQAMLANRNNSEKTYQRMLMTLWTICRGNPVQEAKAIILEIFAAE